MEYRKVKSSGDEISILGFGGMRFPTTSSGKIDEVKAAELLKSAIDQGVNYIDTAYFYHGGQSEQFIGKFLNSGYRSRVKVATKMPPWLVNHEKDYDVIFNEQLKRLQTDVIDYYLLHALNRENWEKFLKLNVFKFLDHIKQSGQAKHIGFSFHGDRELFKEIIDAYPWDFCQIQYNILDAYNQAGVEGLNYAAARDIAVFVMEPLRGGTLVNRLPKEVLETYASAAADRTPAEWALKWIWDHEGVTMLLSGMSEMQHVTDNIAYTIGMKPGTMSDSERQVVEVVKKTYLERQRVPCTGCQYCLPCPFGIDIPRCFDLYNSKYLLGQKVGTFYWMQLGGMNGIPSHASLCVNCGKCLEHCPQRINIPLALKAVTKDLEGPFMKPVMKVATRAVKGYGAIKRKFKG